MCFDARDEPNIFVNIFKTVGYIPYRNMFLSMISVYFFYLFFSFFAKPLYKPFGETVFPFPTGGIVWGSWAGQKPLHPSCCETVCRSPTGRVCRGVGLFAAFLLGGFAGFAAYMVRGNVLDGLFAGGGGGGFVWRRRGRRGGGGNFSF
jgi:hypothetical protein